MERISHFTNDFAEIAEEYIFKNGTKLPIFNISSYHTLVQLIGYAKYLNRSIGNVYLRGQHKMYNTLIPAIFRNCSSHNGGFCNRNDRIGQIIRECTDRMDLIRDLDELVREPILQHYDIGTRWIDLVDNLWIAIWFGIHDWHTRILEREYRNVIPRQGGPNEYMYLLLICSDGDQ